MITKKGSTVLIILVYYYLLKYFITFNHCWPSILIDISLKYAYMFENIRKRLIIVIM